MSRIRNFLVAPMMLFGAVPAAAATTTGACDRRCLLAMLTTYTESLIDHDASNLPLSPDVRITYDGVPAKLGSGEIWSTAKRIAYRQAFVDPETGTAMFLGTLTNTPTPDGDKWWFYALRLKIVDRKISEVEEIAYSGSFAGVPASSLVLPNRIYDTVLPPEEQTSREQLFKIANGYFDAVSGRVDRTSIPWHPECQRIELGVFTVNSAIVPGSCSGEFKVPRMRWNVENRRFYIADVARGVVFAIGNFMTPPEFPDNNGSVVFEVFKIQDGMIRHIEAFFRGNGQAHSGWGTGKGS